MKHQALTFVGLITAGVVLGATLVSTDDSSSGSSKSSSSQLQNSQSAIDATESRSESTSNPFEPKSDISTLAELQDQLHQEIAHRKKLEQKIALLEKRIELIRPDEEPGDEKNESSQKPHASGFSRQTSTGQSTDWFNEQAMLDSGIDPSKVNFIKQSFEQAEMDKLYLRNQAKREGWLNSKRYTDAAKEIADRTKALRNELTENEFDAYLFAAGRSNRVLVSSVLSSSPASDAGIQAGDTILRYDNKRIYSWSDLTNATSEGAANDTVIVTIERNGHTQQVYLPRGPLGVRLATDSVAP